MIILGALFDGVAPSLQDGNKADRQHHPGNPISTSGVHTSVEGRRTTIP
jgi:hypothetical protein